MDNDDNGLGGQNNDDYGNENYNDAGDDNNPDGNNNNNAGGDGDVDQYFDDAGDIGYLPADHVTSSLSLLTDYSLLCKDFKMP